MKLGSDPEVFARKAHTPEVSAAYFVLGGDVDVDLPYGTAYCDGATIEFNVEPSEDPAILADRLFANYGRVEEIVKEKGYVTFLASSAHVVKEHLTSLDKSYSSRASLQIFGCNADYTPYTWINLPIRPNPAKTTLRSIGGHMHVELPPELREDERFVSFYTTALDQSIGLFSLITNSTDPDRIRRSLYGQAGSYRLPKYGYEYRVPPAAFLLGNRVRCEQAFTLLRDVTTKCIELYQTAVEDIEKLLNYCGSIRTVNATISLINDSSQPSRGWMINCVNEKNAVFVKMLLDSKYVNTYAL